ncbi:hypothetical protein R1CP_34000 [Rhodococcus opacus]|uniref:Cation-transporting P-type ATPase C-terminal domain-containing protein n=1 Tax=Rhodococcus opacus TaxID=37919 RepID=A0A1B1KFL5_RHOOP|nr:hypothetical protein R1CP_34000 [Rhodococcus opacus]
MADAAEGPSPRPGYRRPISTFRPDGGASEAPLNCCHASTGCPGRRVSGIGLTSPGDGAIVLPLLATQILWINLLTDGAPALALGVDPETEDVMNRPPRSMRDRVIDIGCGAT